MTQSLQITNLGPLAYAMTRIAAKFSGASIFSPGEPLQPVAHEKAPRQFQYPVAVNLSNQPRRDYPGLTPFETLRYLSKKHPLASLCIRVRAEQVAMLPGGVVAKRKREQASVQRDCDALDVWFDKPDRATQRSAWLQQFVRDMLEIDAATIYKQPTRGGDLYGLEIVDGSTIKPLIDMRGRVVAYQQVIYGLALSQYLGRRVSADEEQVIGEYSPGELLYQPYSTQTYSPYGRAPMEDLLEQAQIYLQKQNYDLGHFTDGNIPGALAIWDSDGGFGDVDQVQDFENNFNAVIQGDVSRGSKMRFIPFPMRIERLAELSTGGQYESAWEERMVKLVCAFYSVTPAEIGFMPGEGLGGKGLSEGAENITYRRGIGPMAQWLKLNVFDPVIQQDFQRPDLEWQWNYGEHEDKKMDADVHASDIGAGVITAQESRSMRYPDLEGTAPGPPQPALPGAATGQAPPTKVASALPAPTEKLAKADTDKPEDEAERLAAEAAALTLVTKIFLDQLKRLRQAVKEGNGQAGSLSGFWQAEESIITRALLPFFDETLGTAALAGGSQLAIGIDWGLVNQSVLKLAREEAALLAAQLNKTSQAQAAQIIADWIADGGSMDELVERLERIYPTARAKATATTTVTRLYARGNLAVYKDSGVCTGWRWNTANDERVCPMCAPRDGEEYGLDDSESLPPIHVGDRCWITPVVMTPEEFAAR
jgi:SPP1 gp7 family putative phage head morphogenesis protein